MLQNFNFKWTGQQIYVRFQLEGYFTKINNEVDADITNRKKKCWC